MFGLYGKFKGAGQRQPFLSGNRNERIDRGDSQSVYSGKPVGWSYRSGRIWRKT